MVCFIQFLYIFHKKGTECYVKVTKQYYISHIYRNKPIEILYEHPLFYTSLNQAIITFYHKKLFFCISKHHLSSCKRASFTMKKICYSVHSTNLLRTSFISLLFCLLFPEKNKYIWLFSHLFVPLHPEITYYNKV